MIIKIRKMLLCVLLIQLLFISLSFVSHAASCSNNWRVPSSQTMETEIMSASMTDYANIERYLSIKQGWKTTHIYFLRGALLVKGLDDDEINYNNIFWYPMMFMQDGVLSKAFPQGPCSITQKTPIALTEAEGEVVPTSQGVIDYNYTLTGKQNVKHFKGVMKFIPKEAAPSDDTVIKGFKIVDQSKPYLVIGGKDMPVTTLGELRRALIEKKNSSKKWTGPIPEIVMAPEDKQGIKIRREVYPFYLNNTYKFVDKMGQVILETPCVVMHDSYDDVAQCANKYFKTGYINREGKIIVEPKYSFQEYSVFSEGLAMVKENGKSGYIDKTGCFVIKPQFETSLDFHEGLAATRMDKKWGFIDKTGRFVIEPKFDNVGRFNEGLAAAYTKGKYGWAYGFINKKGDWVIDPQFFPQPRGFSSGLCTIEKNGKLGFIDQRGIMVIEPQFERMESFIEESAVVKKDGMYFLINKSGNRISEKYEFMCSSGDNMIAIYNNKKFGFMDRTGQTIIEIQFERQSLPSFGLVCAEFSEGLAAVKTDGKFGYINKTGQFVIKSQFDKAGVFKNGIASVNMDGKHCLIDKSGNAFAIKDKVCGHDVVRNSKGEITWPKNIKELCGKSN